MKRVLVVMAHPDDEVLGCGGAIVEHAKKGDSVVIAILGEGVTSRFNKREKGLNSPKLKELNSSVEKAAGILGAEKVFRFDLPDNRFDTVPLLDVVKEVESLKKKVRPAVVYTHHYGDLNVDHRVTFEAVMTAFRPLPGESPVDILACEVLSSSEWRKAVKKDIFVPNYFIDIGRSFKFKQKALSAYKDELRKYPHPRSIEGVEILASRRGMEVGLAKAEAFELIRSVRKGV